MERVRPIGNRLFSTEMHAAHEKRSRRRACSFQAAMPGLIDHVDKLPQRYKGVLLDQFGVLHDGKKAYPSAVEAVIKLKKAGRKIVILSNSSRRSSNTIPKLGALGFPVECFAGAVTSGEITYGCLAVRPDPWWQELGKKCLHLTWGERGAVPVEGMGIEVVEDVDAADFVLAHGTEVLGRGDVQPPKKASLEEIKALLQQAAGRGLPLIVANPDVVTVSGASLIPMPGTFARWYREFGGQVRLMGKPDPLVYISAMELMGLEPQEVLAVGDSLEHDISGANAAGIDSIFIAGGIHAEELSISEEDQGMLNEARLQTLMEEHGATPQYCMRFLN